MTKKEQERLEQEQADFEAQQSAQQELQNHDPQPQQRVDAVTLMRQSNENTIKTGATCADVRTHEGAEIIDKQTNKPKINSQTGEVMTYADKYYATLTFDGGQIETEITREQKDLLEIGSRYSCTGRLAPVRVFGQEVIAPVYYAFTKLY
jgi:hypothetical protein